MRFLDLGCGTGRGLKNAGVSYSDEIVGGEKQSPRWKAAVSSFPERKINHVQGKVLRFANGVLDLVLCLFARPCGKLSLAREEACRVLTAALRICLTPRAFPSTLHELTSAFLKPKAPRFRPWVMLHGTIFDFAGTPAFINGKYPPFQAVGGVSSALRRSGFGDIFSRPALCFPGLIVPARKLFATSDAAAEPRSIRLKEFERSGAEFQGRTGERVVTFEGISDTLPPGRVKNTRAFLRRRISRPFSRRSSKQETRLSHIDA